MKQYSLEGQSWAELITLHMTVAKNSDSYSLRQKLKQLDIEDHLIQISYDIRQLYPSIPVQDTLNITHLELVNDKTLKDRTK